MYNLAEAYLEKVARIVSAHYNIKVVFHKDSCATDGNTIMLPSIPPNADIPFIKALNGMLDHEVAHCIFTEFWVRELQKETIEDQIIFSIFNALEDVRVENEMVKIWPGCALNFRNLTEWTTYEITPIWHESPAIIQFTKSLYIYFRFKKMLGFFDDTVLENKRVALWYDQAADVLKDLPSRLSCTEDAKKEATRIFEALIIPDDEKEPKDEEPEDTNKHSALTPDTDNEQSSSPQVIEESTEESTQSPIEKLEHAEKNLDPKVHIIKHVQNLSHPIEQKEKPYRIFDTTGDIIEYISGDDRVFTKQFIDDYFTTTESIKHKFARVLKADAYSKWEFNKPKGKIHSGSLYRLKTTKNNPRIFKQNIRAPKFDTVAMLLIDHSGSMTGPRIRLASEISLILGECLHTINVPFAVWGYSTGSYYTGINRYHAASPTEKEHYTRWGDLWIGVYKKFEEAWPENRHRCSKMGSNVQNNSYDGETVRKAASYLLRQPQSRKILFVLCDGMPEPNVSSCRVYHRQYLEQITKEVEKEIELYAFGMNIQNPAKFYSNFVNVPSINDLNSIMSNQMYTLLRNHQLDLRKR